MYESQPNLKGGVPDLEAVSNVKSEYVYPEAL